VVNNIDKTAHFYKKEVKAEFLHGEYKQQLERLEDGDLVLHIQTDSKQMKKTILAYFSRGINLIDRRVLC